MRKNKESIRVYYDDMDKRVSNPIRLCIVSLLYKYERLDFNTLKEALGLTDGNLASHLATLEKEELISFQKKFVARKSNTSYLLTELGRMVFIKHLLAVGKLLKEMEQLKPA